MSKKDLLSTIIALLGLIVAIATCVLTVGNLEFRRWLGLDNASTQSPVSTTIPPIQAIATNIPLIPSSASVVGTYSLAVPATVTVYDSDIDVLEGDWLEMVANARWWNGITTTDADGIEGFGRTRDCGGDCPLPGEPLGILVGKVGNMPPFRVGSFTKREIRQDGRLFFVMNENLGDCNGSGFGSCYADNNGILEVNVTLWRLSPIGQNEPLATEAE